MSQIPGRVYLRYTLLQIPAIIIIISVMAALRHYLEIHLLLFWGIILGWLIKDIVMFPFVWRAYDNGRQGSGGDMEGMAGTVTRRLEPQGYVRVRGELWRAVLVDDESAEKGEAVTVAGRDGMLLRVKREK